MKNLTRSVIWRYAIGQLGWPILSGLVSSWLVYFYQPDQTGLKEGMPLFIPQGRVIFGVLTIIGLIGALGRLFDAVTDPLVGNLSDNCKSPLGRRVPFLRYSALPFGISTLLIFCAPIQKISSINTVWLFVFVLLYYFLLTCYYTPYTSLIAELAKSQEEKLSLSTCISLTFIVGTAISYIAPVVWTAFINNGMERVFAMRLTFGIFSALAVCFMLVPGLTLNEKDYCQGTSEQSSMFDSLAKTFSNKDFRIFVGQDVIYWFALTMFQTGLPFFVTALLKLPETYATPMFVGLTAASLLFYLPVNLLAKKFGKKKIVLAAFLFFVADFLFTGLCGDSLAIPNGAQAVIIVLAAAFPMAAFGILPQAMVADLSQAETAVTGQNRSGMFFAARTFAFKLGQSAAMLAFTSLATISRQNGTGYRIVAICASVCCALGALILVFFNEKKIMKEIEGA
ncbi:MAG: MFS transporter [Treponema sp.]|nr:MFS transporter [Treponema sp.]